MDNEVIIEAVLVVLGAAYVLSQLTGDPRDGVFVRTIESIIRWMTGRAR